MADAPEMKISIIMPAYNAERTIIESIQSVIAQSHENWELLIIEDCSKDNTRMTVQNYINELPGELRRKVRFILNKKNAGVSAARNLGVKEASADWIAFLDSDDKWEPEKLAEQAALLQRKPDASIVFTGSAFINTDGKRSSYCLPVPEQISFRQLLKQNVISCSSVLVKRELLLKTKMQHDNLHEDFIVWLTLLKEGYKAYGINRPLLIYRLSSASKSGNKRKAAIMTYRSYGAVGLNPIATAYYLGFYTVRNLRKYKNIRNGFEKTV